MELHKIGIMTTELKPCLYCGKQAYVRYGHDEENSFVDMVYCPHCGAKSLWRTVVHTDVCCTDGEKEKT